ncbi:MAG: hypothetical protein D6761_06995, partial [Candidatus Dadabacteria bacterium]
FAAALAATVGLLFFGPKLPLPAQAALAFWTVWTLVDVNAVFEQPPWLRLSEPLRLLAAPLWLLLAPPLPHAVSAVVLIWSIGSLIAWRPVRGNLYADGHGMSQATPVDAS